jgi:NADH dehydrogenase FAD-containing subunit
LKNKQNINCCRYVLFTDEEYTFLCTGHLQVAERQGKFLVELFNKIGKQNGGKALSADGITLGEQFVYKHMGSMASVGAYKALVDLRQSKV